MTASEHRPGSQSAADTQGAIFTERLRESLSLFQSIRTSLQATQAAPIASQTGRTNHVRASDLGSIITVAETPANAAGRGATQFAAPVQA